MREMFDFLIKESIVNVENIVTKFKLTNNKC
jgi:hypothetical protein